MVIHTAIKIVLLNTLIHGCRFYLGQCWYRKIQHLGLTTDFKDTSSEIGNFIKSFFGLPFRDPSEVNECFVDDIISNMPTKSRVEKLCDYILEKYIQSDAPTPSTVWVAFSSSVCRTTNGCEAFHSKFNAIFQTSHPNLFIFVDALKAVQTAQLQRKIKHNSSKRRISSK